jgi:long-chain fatty acid transport protein
VLAAAVAAVVAAPGAFATNGYMPHGIGTNAKAMGGVGIAFPQDAMAAATNPAGQVLVGNKLSFGMDWFRPFRSATRIVDTSGSYRDSDSNDYFMPEFGYATPVGSSSSLGVVVHGAGLGVDYGTPWAVANTATGATGTNLYMLLKYMYIAPTWAMKAGNHSFGASLNIVKGNFDARGLQAFRTFTPSATTDNLTDRGEDSATGVGVKLGWIGELTSNFAMGATWQPKTNMSKFGRYKELFAQQGDADIPEQYGLGLAWKASPATTVGFDVVKIKWSGVKSFSNSADVALTAATKLGENDGLGFGWKDQTVYKLGVSHQFGKLTLRAGYNYGKMPVVADETMFNTIAPAVTETHYTLGGSWAVSSTTDIGLTYMYSPKSELKGSGTQAASGLTNPDLKMNQNSLGISLNVKM